MNDLKTLLKSKNITRAIIVDDAYETLPLARDLAIDEANWSQFFEDISEADEAHLKGIFPPYEGMRGDDLRASDAFVAALWQHRGSLRKEIVDPLFERYDKDKDVDLEYLERLRTTLTGFELNCITSGRDFVAAASEVDLIVIDLYLASSQDDEAMAFSTKGLKEVIKKRMANPPLVVLMSRSTRLIEKKRQFRDESGLFESTFRIISKNDLAEEGKLPRLLSRLAEHYHDSVKLAAFLNAWQQGLDRACLRTANLIRTLDLADVAQIQQLLLDEEGDLPGSYLVDVFDLVLQHEIEGEDAIIKTALELNQLNSQNYPPPYVAGSPDLQAIVCRSLFHHHGRLILKNELGSPVAFGDILQRKTIAQNAQAAPADVLQVLNNFNYMGNLDVYAVMTPACDLQRIAKRVLLLKGTLTPLTTTNWFYKDSLRTAVYQSNSGERFYIKWDPKHTEVVSNERLKIVLEAPQGFQIVGRLREAPALELQQKLLSDMGRVGLIAPMPATFPVKVEAYLPNVEKKLFKIDAPALSDNPGVCFIGRKSESEARTLVLCEDACESLFKGLRAVDINSVEASARQLVEDVRSSEKLLVLQKGINCLGLSDKRYLDIILTVPANGDIPEQKIPIGLIRQSGDWIATEIMNGNFLRKAGIVLILTPNE